MTRTRRRVGIVAHPLGGAGNVATGAASREPRP
jgi:hypothetical protein